MEYRRIEKYPQRYTRVHTRSRPNYNIRDIYQRISPFNGYYSCHSFALQGETGRPSGGITFLIKPSLAPGDTLYNSQNVLIVKGKAVTIVGSYFNPEYTAEDIDQLSEGLSKIGTHDSVIAVGDMYCRIDRDYSKSISVNKFTQQEGFTLTNKQKACTYVAHNGMSTIDLVFLDNKLTLRTQYEVTNTTTAPIRKHLPVVTIVNTRPVENRPKEIIPVKTSRKLECLHLQGRRGVQQTNEQAGATCWTWLLLQSRIYSRRHYRLVK
jgi:hypothetical protein